MTFQLVDNAVARVMQDMIDRIPRTYHASVKREARILLERGPCSRQAKLASLVGIRCDVYPLNMDDRIRRAISAEQSRGRSGHWAFDPNRLIALKGHALARRYERMFK